MANLELEGRLVKKMPVQSGRSARGDWSKQEFLLEFQEGSFPSTVVFSVWGADKVNDLAKYREGETIKVAFNLSSREYNGKWYTDVRAWRISPAGQAAPSQGGYAAPDSYVQQGGFATSSQPAGFATTGGFSTPSGFTSSAPQPAAPAPTLNDMPGEAFDDLPF